MTWIDLQGLSAGYAGGAPVIAGLDLRVPAEVRTLCVLGPSGVGKSTLLGILAGFLRPAAGEVRVDGLAVRGPSPSRPFTPQHGALFPWLTAEDNIAFGLKAQGMAKAARRAEAQAWLARFGLLHAAKRRPAALSGGMAQRAAILRALILRPPTVLLDEPLSALDQANAEAIEAMLSEIAAPQASDPARVGSTRVVIASHSAASCAYLADAALSLSPTAPPLFALLEAAPHPRPDGFRQAQLFLRRLRRVQQLQAR